MSDIKMCDNCGNIFSVNTPGWDSLTRNHTKMVPGSSHPVTVGQQTFHTCPECTIAPTTVRPRLAISPADKDA